jgi:heme A synthase
MVTLLNLLILVIILGLVFWLVIWALDQIPAFEPFRAVARAIVAILAVVILLGFIFGGLGMPTILH